MHNWKCRNRVETLAEKWVSRKKWPKLFFFFFVLWVKEWVNFSENSRKKMVPDLKGARSVNTHSLLHSFLVHIGWGKPSDLKHETADIALKSVCPPLPHQIVIFLVLLCLWVYSYSSSFRATTCWRVFHFLHLSVLWLFNFCLSPIRLVYLCLITDSDTYLSLHPVVFLYITV